MLLLLLVSCVKSVPLEIELNVLRVDILHIIHHMRNVREDIIEIWETWHIEVHIGSLTTRTLWETLELI